MSTSPTPSAIRSDAALIGHVTGTARRGRPNGQKPSAGRISPELGLVLGAGDGNRTRTVSLGIADHRLVDPAPSAREWSVVTSVAPCCPGPMARQWHEACRGHDHRLAE